MDVFFMDLYRTRLYLPLLFLCISYLASSHIRNFVHRVACWLNRQEVWKVAVTCALISLAFCFGVIYQGKSWGGDFSQYYAQARAIATGTIPEWYQKNIFIIDNSCVIGADVYPWMWALMIAPFYLVYHSFPVMLLKAYESVFVALGVVILAFFFKRRLSMAKTVFLTLFVGCNFVYIMDVNSTEADLISFFWGMVALNFLDLYLIYRKQVWEQVAERKAGRTTVYAVLGGAGICCAVMTKTLCEGLLLALAAYDIVCVSSILWRCFGCRSIGYRQDKETSKIEGGIIVRRIRKSGWIFLLPYVSYFLLMKFANTVLLPSGGSYKDYFTFSSWRFKNGIRWYYGIFQSFFGSGVRPIISGIVCVCGTLLLILTAIGIVLKRREELYYGFYVCGMILMLLFYDYYRSSFVLTFFPLMLLFTCYALEWIIQKTGKLYIESLLIKAVSFAVFFLVLAESCMAVYAVQFRDYNMNDVMTEDTQETFSWIRNNLDSDDVVYFLKPRVLYLYTDVYAYYWDDDNPERLNLADYVLMSDYNVQPNIQNVLDTSGKYSVVFQNDRFKLYYKLSGA